MMKAIMPKWSRDTLLPVGFFKNFSKNIYFILLDLVPNKRSYLLKQACGWKLQVCLRKYDILLGVRRLRVKEHLLQAVCFLFGLRVHVHECVLHELRKWRALEKCCYLFFVRPFAFCLWTTFSNLMSVTFFRNKYYFQILFFFLFFCFFCFCFESLEIFVKI